MMIDPYQARPAKSLAGSPVLKQEDPDDFEEELRSVSNDLSQTSFDFHNISSVIPALESSDLSLCKFVSQQQPALSSNHATEPKATVSSRNGFRSLPPEIHGSIMDYLVGPKVCVTVPTATSSSSSNIWTKARFSRRKQFTDLALVCHSWRQLIQSRVYRQIQMKGTKSAMLECQRWFLDNPHLVSHVRLVEIWIPVWGERSYTPIPRVLDRRRNYHQVSTSREMGWEEAPHPVYDIPFLISDENSSMEEIFQHMKILSSARILILQGGHASNPPEIRQFRFDPCDEPGRFLPRLPQIETLVLRGAWNIVRKYRHWANIAKALPELRELHVSYPTKRSDVEILVAKILNRPPFHLRHVNLNLEGPDGGDEIYSSPGFCPEAICTVMGHIAYRLETLSFTGKVCEVFFSTLRDVCQRAPWPARLKSLEVSVLSICPDPSEYGTGAQPIRGIKNLDFIDAFEIVIIEAVKCLKFLPALTSMNIHFLDASPICPQVKPYFNITNNVCTGIWSPKILDALSKSLPLAKYVELTDGIYPIIGRNGQFVGISPTHRRPVSINTRMYAYIAN